MTDTDTNPETAARGVDEQGWEEALIADLRANGGRASEGPRGGHPIIVMYSTGAKTGERRRSVLTIRPTATRMSSRVRQWLPAHAGLGGKPRNASRHRVRVRRPDIHRSRRGPSRGRRARSALGPARRAAPALRGVPRADGSLDPGRADRTSQKAGANRLGERRSGRYGCHSAYKVASVAVDDGRTADDEIHLEREESVACRQAPGRRAPSASVSTDIAGRQMPDDEPGSRTRSIKRRTTGRRRARRSPERVVVAVDGATFAGPPAALGHSCRRAARRSRSAGSRREELDGPRRDVAVVVLAERRVVGAVELVDVDTVGVRRRTGSG